MTYSTNSPTQSRALRSRLLIGAAAAAVAVAISGLGAGSAQAAFTTGKCQGAAVIGGGASFANSAFQNAFIPSGWPAFCEEVGTAPAVTYRSLGSGCGRYFVGARGTCTGYPSNADGSNSRTQEPRFGMTDEPLTPTVQAQINGGADATGDEGVIRTLPLAMGATAVVVNTPDQCTIQKKPGSTSTMNDGSGNTGFTSAEKLQISDFGSGNANTARLQLTRAQVEGIFNGGSDYDTWGEVVPWINDGNGTAGEASDTRCADYPVFRVRRLDDGGTTFNIKDYLSKLNPSRGWLSTYVTPDSRTWPNADKTVAFDINNDGDTADTVTKCAAQTPQFASSKPDGMNASGIGCTEAAIPTLQSTEVLPSAGNGNDDLVNKVADFDGSIGYGDLSTARSQRTGTFERAADATDTTYWVKLQAKNLTAFVDPQSAPTGYQTAGAKGSNCATAGIVGIPSGADPTKGDWSAASATDTSNAGYGICTLTYALVWDDYSKPYALLADQAAEERKARTVVDFIKSTLADGQLYLAGFDYSPLSASIKAIAQSGIDQVSWGEKPDVEPPAAPSITSAPSGSTTSTSASIAFTGEAGATFECALDGGSYAPCTSPRSLTGLSLGSHTFYVKQTDGAGNTSVAATATWTVAGVPSPQLSGAPTGSTRLTTATLTFSSTVSGATFLCSLDGAAFAACTSPRVLSGLSVGSHTFRVKAVDTDGNQSASTDASWTITRPNAPTVTGAPTGNVLRTVGSTLSYTGEAGATFECSLNGAAYAACTSPRVFPNTALGTVTFAVRQVKDGSASEPTTRTWTVVPDNRFTVSSVSASTTTRKITITTGNLPSGGVFTAIGRATLSGKLTTIGSLSSSKSGAGPLTVTLTPTSTFISAVKKTKGKGIVVTLTLGFTPTGGTSGTPVTRTVTVK